MLSAAWANQAQKAQTMKKIALRSEVIRNLNANSLARVRGGVGDSMLQGCQPARSGPATTIIETDAETTVGQSVGMHCAL